MYKALRNNYYGGYVIDANQFKGDLPLQLDIECDEQEDYGVRMADAEVKVLTVQNVDLVKFIVVQTSQEVSVAINDGATNIVTVNCNPLFIWTNSSVAAGPNVATITLTNNSGLAANVSVRIAGDYL